MFDMTPSVTTQAACAPCSAIARSSASKSFQRHDDGVLPRLLGDARAVGDADRVVRVAQQGRRIGVGVDQHRIPPAVIMPLELDDLAPPGDGRAPAGRRPSRPRSRYWRSAPCRHAAEARPASRPPRPRPPARWRNACRGRLRARWSPRPSDAHGPAAARQRPSSSRYIVAIDIIQPRALPRGSCSAVRRQRSPARARRRRRPRPAPSAPFEQGFGLLDVFIMM